VKYEPTTWRRLLMSQAAVASCGGSYLCTGVVGYDGPTGNGTPNGTTAF
jgi:hypothetical protein